jgi:hypothetical protein
MNTNTRFKAFVLNVLNTGFPAACRKLGFETNSAFRGVYSLTPGDHFEKLAMSWIANGTDKTLIMFHPSSQVETGDAISRTRVAEYRVLSGEAAPVRAKASGE